MDCLGSIQNEPWTKNWIECSAKDKTIELKNSSSARCDIKEIRDLVQKKREKFSKNNNKLPAPLRINSCAINFAKNSKMKSKPLRTFQDLFRELSDNKHRLFLLKSYQVLKKAKNQNLESRQQISSKRERLPISSNSDWNGENTSNHPIQMARYLS